MTTIKASCMAGTQTTAGIWIDSDPDEEGVMGAIKSPSAARPRRNCGTCIRSGLTVAFGAFALLVSGCASATGTTAATSPSGADAEVVSPSASASSISSGIVGYWHRAHTCEELVPAFEAAGLADSHRGWLQGNFYGGAEGPSTGDVCAGAEGPLEHSHWFTETGEFGSHDQTGHEVDSGDYTLVDSDTLSFPSHSTEFGFAGDILVDFAIDDGVATFRVNIPESCDAACQDAHAWALSAFASGPWAEGDVP